MGPDDRKAHRVGHLNREVAEVGAQVAVEWDIAGTGERAAIAATVAELPFLQLRRRYEAAGK